MPDFAHPLSFSMCEQFVTVKIADEKRFFNECEKWAEQQIKKKILSKIYLNWQKIVNILQDSVGEDVSPACANYFERNYYILQSLRFINPCLVWGLWSEEQDGGVTLLYVFKEFVLHKITENMIAEAQNRSNADSVRTLPLSKKQLWEVYVMSLHSVDWNKDVDILPFLMFYRYEPEKNNEYLNKIHTFECADMKVSEYKHVDNMFIAMVEILKQKAQKLLVLHKRNINKKSLQQVADSVEEYVHSFHKAYPNASAVSEPPIWIDPYEYYGISPVSKTQNSAAAELCKRIEQNWKYQLSFMYYFPNSSKNI